MAGRIIVGDNDFEDVVLNADILTLVDFGAEWCGPCKKLHPIMDELADEYDGKIKVCEVDVGVSAQTGMKYGITSVPQLLFFRDGVVKETIVGLLPKSKIEEKIEKHLS